MSELQELTSLTTWDTARVWKKEWDDLPTLRLDQRSAPVLTAECPSTPMFGVPYSCTLAVSDEDVNERQFVLLEERTHSCGWLSASQDTSHQPTDPKEVLIHGTPTLDDLRSCTAAFYVTDGPHAGDPQVFQLDVQPGLVMTPSDSSGLSYDMGTQPVDSGGTSQVFTLANEGPVAVSALSVEGLPSYQSHFDFEGGTYPGTGGTCGTALEPGQTCTMAIAFTPTTTGSKSATIYIDFTGANGPATYEFRLRGLGI